jgi:hypothetical protein
MFPVLICLRGCRKDQLNLIDKIILVVFENVDENCRPRSIARGICDVQNDLHWNNLEQCFVFGQPQGLFKLESK